MEAVGGCLLRELARKGSFLKREWGAGDISSCHFNFLRVSDGSLPLRDNTRMLDMHFAVVTECYEQTHASRSTPWTPCWLSCHRLGGLMTPHLPVGSSI